MNEGLANPGEMIFCPGHSAAMGLENLTGFMMAAVKLYRKTLRLILDQRGDVQAPFAG
jgi:hypothetical protein